MPCKIYLQVWILEFVGPLAPPAPHRLPRKELFLGKELVPFTQLVKVRRGQLVLALPNIRFS